MSLLNEISRRFRSLPVSEKLILINVFIFIADRLLVFLFKLSPDFFMRWGDLPWNIPDFLLQPWSLITYAFFHAGFGHLFWNMLLLYFFGRLFLELFSPRRFVTVYFLGAASGGLFFILSYNFLAYRKYS